MTRPASATPRDYSLAGPDAQAALERGLASTQWYRVPLERKRLRALMQRSDGPAIRDTLIWLAGFGVMAAGAIWFWPTAWALPFLAVYGVLYGSSTDSRWHECGHGTAFRTDWMNRVIYQISCFMIMREPAVWRWSHTRHHTDTIIVGRDPEIAIMRPTVILKVLLSFFAIPQTLAAVKSMVRHACGRLSEDEKTFIPKSETPGIYRTARIWLALHLSILALAITLGSLLPLLLVGVLPTMYGAWLHVLTGLTQHGGLREDVLDHRLNSRTVLMNPVLRFLYWNMNYHIEHHMFPMVPYHALPALYEELKPWMPEPSRSVWAAYREIIPAILRQAREPGWSIPRTLPTLPTNPERTVA